MNEYADKTTQKKNTVNSIDLRNAANSGKHGFYLTDNRPSTVIQQKKNELANPAGQPVQRVSIKKVRNGSDIDAGIRTSSSPIQAVRIGVAKRGDADDEFLQSVIEEMTKIVGDAEAGNKAPNSGKEHKRLEEILASDELRSSGPSSTRGTYGIGGSHYIPEAPPITTTQGPSSFGDAVRSAPGSGTVDHLGPRPTGLHDEIFHITHKPGLQALASTQGHCFFCYGLIHGRGYEHGPMRSGNMWPQNWEPDSATFSLKIASSSAGGSSSSSSSSSGHSPEHANDAIIHIQSGFGERYYYVKKKSAEEHKSSE